MLRDEGAASMLRRYADRASETRRRRSFSPVDRQSISRFASPRRVVLNYLPSPPAARFGGAPLQLIARLDEEARRRSVALLYPIGNRYRLELESGELRHSIEYPRTETSVLALTDTSFEQVISEVVRGLEIPAVHFEGAAELPLESVAKLRQSGFRVVLSLHDFALFCARPNLFEQPVKRFCNYCDDLARCDRCLLVSWPVEAGTQLAHREAARRVLSSADAVIYPSEFMRRQHRELFRGADVHKELAIEPAIKSATVFKAAALRKGAPKHVAFVGAVTAAKGVDIFEEVVAYVAQAAPGGFRWSVFGGGDNAILRRLRASGVTMHGYYRAGTLPSQLKRHAVDVALLLSIVPESFGLTLSECWAAGVPAIAFDHGAIAERIRRYGGGALVKLEDGSRGVANTLEAIANGRSVIPALDQRAPIQTPQNAAAAYLQLYKDLGIFAED